MPAHHADVADVGVGPWITTRRRQETVVLAHADDVTDGWLRTPDRSMISRFTAARRRCSASVLLSSRAALRRLNRWPARAMCTVRRRRTAMWPSAVARWVLPTPTVPVPKPRGRLRRTAG